MVRGRGARLAAHSADERQLRRAVPHLHSREDAGPRLRRAQFAAILILQRGVLSCRKDRIIAKFLGGTILHDLMILCGREPFLFIVYKQLRIKTA